MDFRERDLKGVNWINLAQDKDHWWALVVIAMNKSLCSIKGRKFLD
jgi:hypothetical protein